VEKEELTAKIIGRAMTMHRALGPGYLESVYQNALLIELKHACLSAECNVRIPVSYRGEIVGDFIADILVENGVLLELKAAQEIHPAHEAQLVNYLQATGVDIGLVPNFGVPSLQIKRKHRIYRPQSLPVHPENPAVPVKKSLQNAFALLELMAAMAVMSILLVLLLNMVDSGTKLWRANENRVGSYREARAALGIISRDLQNALAVTNTQFLLDTKAFPQVATIGSAVTDTNSGSAVFFLSAIPLKAQESSNKSDVCQVGYFLAFDRTTASTNKSLNLYRYFRSSDATFTSLTANSLFQNPAIGPAGEELLARNVTGFRITAYTWSTNNTLTNFTTNNLPDLVEIRISAINQDAGKKLDNDVSTWTDTNSATYSSVIEPVEQTFTTRIKLNRPQ